MTTFLGYVPFKQAGKDLTAHLTEDGWNLPELPTLARYLNLVVTSSRSPNDREPTAGIPSPSPRHSQ
jgi:hypothetical protein